MDAPPSVSRASDKSSNQIRSHCEGAKKSKGHSCYFFISSSQSDERPTIVLRWRSPKFMRRQKGRVLGSGNRQGCFFDVFIMVAVWKERAGKIGGKDEKKGGSSSRFMSNRFDVNTGLLMGS